MRNFTLTAAALMLAVALLYGGLNLVECGMAQMLGRERVPEAFALQRSDGFSVLVTFSGRTALLDPAAALGAVKNWWERLHAD